MTPSTQLRGQAFWPPFQCRALVSGVFVRKYPFLNTLTSFRKPYLWRISLFAILACAKSKDQNSHLAVRFPSSLKKNITKIAHIFFGRACDARTETKHTFLWQATTSKKSRALTIVANLIFCACLKVPSPYWCSVSSFSKTAKNVFAWLRHLRKLEQLVFDRKSTSLAYEKFRLPW